MIEHEVLLDIYDGGKEIKHNKILFWTALNEFFPHSAASASTSGVVFGGFGLRP
jgi:hypothetical protein